MLITWKVNIYTCAEIYLTVDNVQKFNNHIKPTSKYLECWSCDKEANTGKAWYGVRPWSALSGCCYTFELVVI